MTQRVWIEIFYFFRKWNEDVAILWIWEFLSTFKG